ncbi:unnamed protein product [Adineta ricciae]|uniref:Uncharacterized protein n=1 Tax=Adineta ricciae TaxID=249248 RepID=A0A815BQS0_ADIRI|nr:unnamed protein product [Adineta ricciae]CAF1275033.1 unnamed protein product [Adineta ricciae]
MVDRKIGIILIIAGVLSLTSVILSLYSISSANWSKLGLYSIGLFQTCLNSQCTKNQYETSNSEMNSPPIFSGRLYNAAPLAIVAVFIQLIVCFLCFLTAFIYLPPKPSIMCYITPLLIFLAFIFQFVTITEASYGIHLNGPSSSIFESALVIQVVILVMTFYCADDIRQNCSVQYV